MISGAALVLSMAMAGQAAAGVGGITGVTPYPEFEQQPQTCPMGIPALTPDRVRSILKRRGYYAIRDLRYLKPLQGEWLAPVLVIGHYVATASRGFGLVRWQLSVDPCTARVAVARGAQTKLH
jgi:hypothetical protein